MGMAARRIFYGALLAGIAEVFTIVLPANQTRADTRVSTAVTTGATFTDNVDFEPNGDPELLLTVTPSISFSQQSGRSTTEINFAVSGQYSALDQTFDVINSLDAFNRLNLVEDVFSIESAATISQEPIDSRRGVPVRQGDRSKNLTTVQRYSVTPVVRFQIGSFAVSETRSQFGYVNSGSESLEDGFDIEASTHLTSGSDFSRFRWDVSADYEVTDVGSSDEGTSQTYELDTETVVERRLSLIANVGYEDFEDNSLSNPPKGVFWSAGIHTRPGPKLDLTATYGRRFDEDNPFVDLKYQASDRATLRATFERSLVTNQEAFLQDLTFIGVDAQGHLIDIRTGQPIDPNVDFFGLTNDTFLRTLGTARFDLTGRRNDYGIEATYENRDFQTGSSDETSWGGSLSWTHQLSREMTTNVRGAYDRVEFQDDGRIDNYFTVEAILTRQFNDTLSGSLSYTWRLLDSSDPSQNAIENAVTASLTKTF